MLLAQNLSVHVMLFNAVWVALVLIITTFSLTVQCSKKKQKNKKKGAAKADQSHQTPEAPPLIPPAVPPGTPPFTDEKKPAEGDKKKKGGSSVKKEKGKDGAAEKGKGDGRAAKALVTAMGPTPPTTTILTEQTMLQLQNVPKGMIPVLIPPSQPGGTPTVFMMPSKDMQSAAALTAQPATPMQKAPTKTTNKDPSLYEAIEISKRSIGKKESGNENNKSKKSKREEIKQGMADQGSYQTLADIDAANLFEKK